MRVTLTADRDHQAIFDDEDFQRVVEEAGRSKAMLQFVGAAIRRYEDREQVLRGRAGGDQNMEAFAATFHRDSRARATAVSLARSFAQLYERFDPGNARGCLIEAMVQTRLRSRYDGPQALLDNNAFVTLANGVEYTTSTSVDVVGHDGGRGECHDCKARGRNVETAWIAELVAELAPHRFRIGVATADSTSAASQQMTTSGFQIPAAVTVTGPESWWDGLPLWEL
jgi:hypothetical protein